MIINIIVSPYLNILENCWLTRSTLWKIKSTHLHTVRSIFGMSRKEKISQQIHSRTPIPLWLLLDSMMVFKEVFSSCPVEKERTKWSYTYIRGSKLTRFLGCPQHGGGVGVPEGYRKYLEKGYRIGCEFGRINGIYIKSSKLASPWATKLLIRTFDEQS